jgi:glycosyltransferase involved in cell wall biosynthesis
MSKLSICCICQDEEELIGEFLECCKHFYDNAPDNLSEIIIADGGSQDNTVEIIKQYINKMPLILIEHPFDTFGQQKNRCMDLATGDFIFFPDADMTWTTNFPEAFKSGFFDCNPMWDFILYFTVRDKYHYFHKWPLGPSLRMWKSGPRYGTNFHEKLQGQHPGLPICSHVTIFENSCRQSDNALLNRGKRYQRFLKEMVDAGAGPGPEDKYLKAAHVPDSEIGEIPNHIRSLIL